MSRGKAAHKRERKRRHERQIAAGERVRRQKIRKPFKSGRKMAAKRTVLLSTVDSNLVREVCRKVKEMEL